MDNIQIILNNVELVGVSDADIQLQMTLKTVKDPSNISGFYTYDFEIPGTKENNKIFNHIFDITSQTTFNPNGNNTCDLRVNSITIFVGKLQLNSISKRFIGENEEVFYNVTLYSYTKSLFNDIGEKTMRDLDFSAYNHYPSEANISGSWTHTHLDGYTYPMIDYGYNWTYAEINEIHKPNIPAGITPAQIAANPALFNQPYWERPLRPYDFKPAVFVKTALDKIFSEAGYTYQSDFFNSSGFTSLVYPYSSENTNHNELLVAATVPGSQMLGYTKRTSPTVRGGFSLFANYPYFHYNSLATPSDIWNGQSFVYKTAVGNGAFVIANDEETTLFFVAPEDGVYTFEIQFNIKSASNYFDFSLRTLPPSSTITSIPTYYEDSSVCEDIEGGDCRSYGLIAPNVTHTQSYNFQVECVRGEKIFTFLYAIGTTYVSKVIMNISAGAHFNSNGTRYAPTDSNVHLEKCFNFDLKQRDFLNVLNKMFNLYWEQDKTNPNIIRIEPHESFYTTDYAIKSDLIIDKSAEYNIEYLSDEQFGKVKMNYEDGDDFYNKTYDESHDLKYGEAEVIYTGNTFLTNEVLEITAENFQPSVLGYLDASKKIAITKYFNGDDDTKQTIVTDIGNRILYYKPLTGCTFLFNGSTASVIPYAGHQSNPMSVNSFDDYDLNYSTNSNFMLGNPVTTSNNLYDLYWKNYIDSINNENALRLNCWLKMSEVEISKIKFNDIIFLEGVYYHIETIKYDVGEKKHAVSLIKINDELDDNLKIIFKSNPVRTKWVPVDNLFKYQPASWITSKNPTSVSKSIIIGDNNSAYQHIGITNAAIFGDSNTLLDNSTYASAFGSMNYIGGTNQNAFIVGGQNYISSGSSFVKLLGSNNTVGTNASDLSIMGNNNRVANGVSGVTLVGNNITATTSNATYLSDTVISQGIGEIGIGLKKTLQPSDLVVVKPDYQYHIYNDFTLLSGSNATANGQILIENGDLNLQGDLIIGANGDLTIIDEASGTTGGSGGVSIHNLLSGLQGGQSSEYYHLTSAEYVALQSGFTAGEDTSVIYNNNGVLSGDTNLAYDYDNIRFRLGVKKDSINSNAFALTDSPINAYGLFLGNATSAGFGATVKGVGYDDNDVGLLLAGQLPSTASTGNGLQLRSSLSGSTIGDSQKLLQIQNYTTQKLTMYGNGAILFGYNSSFAATPELPFHFYPGSGAQGMPATSGTSQTGVIRVGGVGTSGIMDIGNYGGNGSWFQATNRTNLALNYPIFINPNGGNVGIGTTATTATLHVHKPTAANNYLKFTNTDTGAAVGDGFDLGITTSEKAIIWNYEPTSLSLAANNIERVTILSGGSVGINTTTPEATLQVSGSTRMGNSTGYTQVASDGHMTMVGSATFWDDLLIEPVVRGTGAQNPTFERWYRDSGGTSNGVYLYSFDDALVAAEKEVYFSIQISHKWAGSPIKFHTHWTPSVSATTAAPRWGFEYTWAGIGNDFGSTNTIYSDGNNYVSGGTEANLTAGRHYLSLFPEITPTAAQDYLSSILICRLFRNSSSTADTYTNKVGLLYADIHIECNSLGSNTEYSK
jgi:hypothetical protein